MTTRDTETLAELINEYAGKGPNRGSRMTFEQLSQRSVAKSGYRPSANLLWTIAKGHDPKPTPELIEAIAEGTGADITRVRAAAGRQLLGGWAAADLQSDNPEVDEVIRVARREGVTPDDMPAVRAFFRALRAEREGGDE